MSNGGLAVQGRNSGSIPLVSLSDSRVHKHRHCRDRLVDISLLVFRDSSYLFAGVYIYICSLLVCRDSSYLFAGVYISLLVCRDISLLMCRESSHLFADVLG